MKTRVVTEKALFDLKFQTMDIDRTYKVYLTTLEKAKVGDVFCPEFDWPKKGEDVLAEQLTVTYKSDTGCAVVIETLCASGGELGYKDPEIVWVDFINKPDELEKKEGER